MQVLKSIQELLNWKKTLSQNSLQQSSLGFVPTMGALHDGHLSLIKNSISENQNTIVSIFINPLQFGPNEDLSNYPRTETEDLALCKEAGVQAVFLPSIEELYGPNYNPGKTLKVHPPQNLSNCLCGSSRAGHFEGVSTVVAKLFNLVQPTKSYFGEKDFQQLVIIKNMVKALNFPTEIVPVPTVRETNPLWAGLAMSSRNKYLNQEAKIKASKLFQSLETTCKNIKAGIPISEALSKAKNQAKQDDYQLEYIEIRDNDNLELITQFNPKENCRIFIAAKIGQTRLIDNLAIT
jgi:pantoate ligase / CMP/dCMP kinase